MGRPASSGVGGDPQVARGVRARVTQVLIGLVEYAIILFAGAGTLRWGAAWALLAIICAGAIASGLLVHRRDPQLAAERGVPGANAKKWDRWLGAWVGDAGPMTLYLVAALDKRWGWSAPLGPTMQALALLLVVAGHAAWTWAMANNRFFSKLVRIQTDRGHAVASGGPYRLVRHPGYAAAVLYTPCMAIGLGSLWALLPAAITVAVFVVRTRLEDRALQAELPGYREYAARVRYRLIPGVW
jgi:protein-S-isoprenylcysteine O-methyltransferase Ste14